MHIQFHTSTCGCPCRFLFCLHYLQFGNRETLVAPHYLGLVSESKPQSISVPDPLFIADPQHNFSDVGHSNTIDQFGLIPGHATETQNLFFANADKRGTQYHFKILSCERIKFVDLLVLEIILS